MSIQKKAKNLRRFPLQKVNEMMRRPFLALLAVSFLLTLGMSIMAQRPQRIVFPRGKSAATVSGTLTGYNSKRSFLIHVRRGQVLTTENIGNNSITISIEAPPGSTYEQDMAADCHDRNEVNPTSAGDYKITVVECRKADRWRGRFKFRVRVR